jgi:hypothetical protein
VTSKVSIAALDRVTRPLGARRNSNPDKGHRPQHDLFLRITSVCPRRVFELDANAPKFGPYRSRVPDRQQSPLN